MSSTTDSRGSPVSRRTPRPETKTRHETLLDLLTQAKRDAVPIRPSFVQQGKGASTKPGPLATFVSKHDARALDAYLIVHALASTEPWNCNYPSHTWIRALGLREGAELASAQAATSKTMRRLEERKLITRSRVGRTSSIVLLKEDGSGDAYELPATVKERYFKLPHDYWTERHYETLGLAAKAMLLISLSLRPGFPLPYGRGPAWYGLSADSTEKGLRELEKVGLLDFDFRWLENVRSEFGWIEQRLYSLQGPYAPPAARKRKPQVKKAAKKSIKVKKASTRKGIKKSGSK